jgi:hypothetical protein
MTYYVMVSKSIHPGAVIQKCYRDHLQNNNWMGGEYNDFDVPQPVVYELKDDRYEMEEPPNIRVMSDSLPVPVMHNSLCEALLAAGVDNIQYYDAVIRDLKRGIDHTDYKAFNIVGVVAAADMTASTMMGTSDSTLIDADFDRLVLDEKKCNGMLLFRLAENITAIVVSEVVKNEVEKRGIKGMFFYPSGEWAG